MFLRLALLASLLLVQAGVARAQERPRRIWLTNRSLDKAEAMARECGGTAFPWEELDSALARADIVLSTTGAPAVIVSQARWQAIQAKRSGGAVVILDIAVPRDFDPRIHDGDRACLFNIDDLQRIRAQTLTERQKHVAPAEAFPTIKRRELDERVSKGAEKDEEDQHRDEGTVPDRGWRSSGLPAGRTVGRHRAGRPRTISEGPPIPLVP